MGGREHTSNPVRNRFADPFGFDSRREALTHAQIMLATLHATAAGVAGRFVTNKGDAIAIGIATHAVLDVLNHEEPFRGDGSPRTSLLILDLAGTFAALSTIALTRGARSAEFTAAVSSILPDIQHLVSIWLGANHELFPFHTQTWHSKFGRKISAREQFAAAALLTLAIPLRHHNNQRSS